MSAQAILDAPSLHIHRIDARPLLQRTLLADSALAGALVLLPLVIVMFVLGRQHQAAMYGACAVVTLNTLCVIASVMILAGGFFDLTAAGIAFVAA